MVMKAFLSYRLRCIWILLCVLVSLPQQDAFTPSRRCHVRQQWFSDVDPFSPSMARSASSVFGDRSKVASRFPRFLDRKNHASLLRSSSPDQNDEAPKDTETTVAAVVTPSLQDLSPTERILATEKMDPTTRAVVEAAQKRLQTNDEAPKYPIDLPSPILLSTSMILAIASAGCLFELLGGSQETMVVGFGPTVAIALLGTPLSIFLLYAAITKATAETEEDDQAFLSGK